MKSSREEDVPFEDLPPKERIVFLLDFLRKHMKMMDAQAGYMYTAQELEEHAQEFWPQITDHFMNAIHEEPSLVSDTFTWGGLEMPLMHWICRLGCGLPLVEAVYSAAGQESLMIRANDSDEDGHLPLHEACAHAAPVELIRFLVQHYPKSTHVRCHDQLPLQMALHGKPKGSMNEAISMVDPFDENDRGFILFRLLSESLSQEELLSATRELKLNWNERSAMPLGVIGKVASLHECKSVLVRVFEGHGCSIEIKEDVIICKVGCGISFDFALEQLLRLHLPIKSLEAENLDIPKAVLYFINAINPPQQDELMDGQMIESHSSMFGRPREPLDLSNIEKVHIDAVIENEDTMLKFVTSLRRLPNLKELYLGGTMNRMEESIDLPLTAKVFQELATVLNEFHKLKVFELDYVEQSTASLLSNFLLAYDHLEQVSFSAREVLTASQVKDIARFLRASKSIKSLKLGPLKKGAQEDIIDAIKDHNSVLEEFIGEGEYCLQTGTRLDFDSTKIDACLAINKVEPQLSGISIKRKDAYEIFHPYLQNTPVLFALLRYRPDLWCNSSGHE